MGAGCLPHLGSINFWKKKSKKEERTAKEVLKLITVKKYEDGSSDKQMTEEFRVRKEEVSKSRVQDSSTAIKYGSMRGKEVTGEKPDQEVAEIFTNEVEDGEFKDNSTVDELKTANKNSSSREKEVIAVEAKKMAYENRDLVMAFAESLRVMDVEKDEKSNEKQPVKQGLWSVDANGTQEAKQCLTQDPAKTVRASKPAEHVARRVPPRQTSFQDTLRPTPPRPLQPRPPQPRPPAANPRRATIPPFPGSLGAGENMSYTHIFEQVKEERREGVRSRGTMNDEFHKVKTFDLRGVQSKGRKIITWPRFFQ